MYPTISDFLREVLGINIPLPIQSYGFFVASAFLIGIWIMIIEMKRKEREGIFFPIEKKVLVGEPAKPKELIISGLIGFIIGFKLVYAIFSYSKFVANPQDFLLSLDGNWIGGFVIGALSAFMTWRDKNKHKLEKPHFENQQIFPHQMAGNILVVAGISGIIGAKIFHNLENFDELIANPWESLISLSGLSFFGGLLIGAVAVVLYARKNKINVLQLADVAAIVLPLAYAVGRIGCQVAGDGCWGIDNINPQPEWLSWLPEWTWAYNYPHNIINDGVLIPDCDWSHCHVLAVPVFPTPLYETTIMLAVFGILFSIRKKIKIPGVLISLYMIFAGVERFLIESIRINNVYHIFGYDVTQAELISVFLVISGIIGLVWAIKYHKKQQAIIAK
jgi:prolipoprotein diacylglyceryl transferase